MTSTSRKSSADPRVDGVFAPRDGARDAEIHILAGLEPEAVPIEAQDKDARAQAADVMNAMGGILRHLVRGYRNARAG